MNKKLFFVTYLFFAAIAVQACDTSLIQLFAIESEESIFFNELKMIAEQNNEIGRKLLNLEFDDTKTLNKLMGRWINFQNIYRVNPPKWAKKDKTWEKKFKEVALLIGSIRKNYSRAGATISHQSSLILSRKLSNFLEFAPIPKEKAALVKLPFYIHEINSAFRSSNRNQLLINSELLSDKLGELGSSLATSTRMLIRRIRKEVKILKSKVNPKLTDKEIFNWKSKLIIDTIEEKIKEVNLKLIEEMKGKKK